MWKSMTHCSLLLWKKVNKRSNLECVQEGKTRQHSREEPQILTGKDRRKIPIIKNSLQPSAYRVYKICTNCKMDTKCLMENIYTKVSEFCLAFFGNRYI